MARDTKLGPEEITRDIPERLGRDAEEPRRSRHRLYRRPKCAPATSWSARCAPKGESPMTPEEELLRAIFGEKASDVRDTSLRVPPGAQGTVVEVRVFNRHGVEKDERRCSPSSSEEIEPLAEDRDEAGRPSSTDDVYGRAGRAAGGAARASPGRRASRRTPRSPAAVLDECAARSRWWLFAPPNDKVMAEIEAIRKTVPTKKSKKRSPSSSASSTRSKTAARRRDAARRHGDGQGLRRREAQDSGPATRWPAATATRAWCRRSVPARGHAVPAADGTAGRRRARSARRAEPHGMSAGSSKPASAAPAPASASKSAMPSIFVAVAGQDAEPLRGAVSRRSTATKGPSKSLDDEGLVELSAAYLRHGVPICDAGASTAPRRPTSSTCSILAGLVPLRASGALSTGAPAIRSTAR